jgi:hypothetical protein
MSRPLAAFALFVTLGLGACEAPDPNGPSATVEKLYQPYLTKGGDTAAALTTAPLTASLQETIDKAISYGNLLDEPVLDFDPIINAQEAEITNVKVARQRQSGDAATVVASFHNIDRDDSVTYDLKHEERGWRIDNIRPGKEDLRALIVEALRPVGDAAAMTAPVQALYDGYGPTPSNIAPVAPLAKSPQLTSAFATLMQRRQDKIAGGAADPLGFDPVVDGTDWKISDLTLEAASSSVIARFTNGQAAKVIVYYVIQENGAWRIDNIRSPGVWDVRMKLLDAGIQ